MADEETLDWIIHWDCYPNPHYWWTSAYIVSIICLVVNAAFLIANINKLLIKKEVQLDAFIKETPKKLFYLLIIILYTLGPCIYFITDSLQIGCSLTVYWFLFLKALGLQTMTFATEMLYLFYVLRITRVFGEIPGLRFPKCLLHLFYSGFCAQIVCQSISFWFYLQAFEDMTNTKHQELALQWSYGALACYVLFVIVILVLFAHKVYQLVHYDSETNGRTDTRQSKRASVFAIRYLWLAAVALCTTMILAVVSVFRSMAGLKMSIIMIKNMCLTIDTVVNVICLYLQFPFADSCYFKLCSVCHFGLVKLVDSTKEKKKKRKKEDSYKSGDTGFTTVGTSGTATQHGKCNDDKDKETVTCPSKGDDDDDVPLFVDTEESAIED